MFPKRPPRLSEIWVKRPVFFITIVSVQRKHILASEPMSALFNEEWQTGFERHGWAVGEYVIMPDHVHFFCREARPTNADLTKFVGGWKEWTAKRLGKGGQLWQPGFFDRLMRQERDWEEKRLYMLDNPVRAGLVEKPEEWPFLGDLNMFRE